MTAPFPHFVTAQEPSPGQTANVLFGHYVWIARWSDEISNDAQLDLKKLAQLAFIHCRVFAETVPTAPISDELIAAVVQKFASEGLEWVDLPTLKADFVAIKNASQTFYEWVRDNAPEAQNFAERTFNPNTNNEVEVAKVIAKPNAVQTRVAVIRALFA